MFIAIEQREPPPRGPPLALPLHAAESPQRGQREGRE
jgi:hypothetical protein